MASQIFQVTPGPLINGSPSQVSVVLPAAQSLLFNATSTASLGKTTGSSGFTDDFLDDETIYPLLPLQIPRYKRDRKIDDEFVHAEIEALQDDFSSGILPDGWKQVTHPEGLPYFYHASKQIVTDCWLWEPDVFQILNGFIRRFEDFTRSKGLSQPTDTYLVLEINIEAGRNWCGYYYASASTRSLFWLETFDISSRLNGIRGTLSPSHIRLYLESQYWFHWDLYPHVNSPTKELYALVASTITDSRTDVQTSNSTTVNQSKDELKEWADIVESARSERFNLREYYLLKFISLRMQIIKYSLVPWSFYVIIGIQHKEDHKRTWLIKVFSPLLFSAPNVHLKSLHELWVDELALKTRCMTFFLKLNTQWGEHIVHASILLNANVAFLAIPSNDPSNNSDKILSARSSAQVASYISVVTSFASMLLALMLVRNHKAKEHTAAEVGSYHEYLCKHSKRGFEDLAIIYSLPYALLTWGLGTFLLAFMLMCFVSSTPAVRTVIALCVALIGGFIIWCILMFWEKTDLSKPTKDFIRKWGPKWLYEFLVGKEDSSSVFTTTGEVSDEKRQEHSSVAASEHHIEPTGHTEQETRSAVDRLLTRIVSWQQQVRADTHRDPSLQA
ncbi:hypothetical protein H0H87_008489 [Tephrocybe sp. NHM501043]|nr:hypothetical protein H0H87_008489 [Tephrocybe sp. NHM501043]